jgi:hypothetical protein
LFAGADFLWPVALGALELRLFPMARRMEDGWAVMEKWAIRHLFFWLRHFHYTPWSRRFTKLLW